MQRDAGWSHLLPWLLGLAYLLAIAPLGLLDGTAGPLLLPRGDLNQYQGVVDSFLAEPWQWPPFHVTRPAWPEGISLFEADGLPLVALAGKLWRELTGDTPSVLGLWIAASYLLQPVAAAYLVRVLGARGWLAALAAGVMALSLPAFHFRFGHAALQAQWQLLLALALALGSSDPLRGGRRLLLLALLAWAGLWINAYVFVMAAVLLAGAWLDRLWAAERRRRLLAGAVLWLLGVALLFQATGYGQGGDFSAGFQRFSMNLISPVVPQVSGLLPGFADWTVNDADYRTKAMDDPETFGNPHDALADMIDATGGQYEGYNWLGFGLLLLALLALVRPRRLAPLLAGRGAILLACVALALVALSNRVWLAYGMWFELPAPPNFIGEFRSCGRFFWPLAYLLLGLGIAVAAARPRRTATLLLGLGLLLQAADAWPWHLRTWRQLHDPGQFVLDVAVWRPLIAAHRQVVVLPPLGCRARLPGVGQEMAYLALESGRAANSYYLARPRRDDCESQPRERFAAPPEPGLLYYLRPPLDEDPAAIEAAWPGACRAFAQGLVCSSDSATLDAAGFAALPSGKTPD